MRFKRATLFRFDAFKNLLTSKFMFLSKKNSWKSITVLFVGEELVKLLYDSFPLSAKVGFWSCNSRVGLAQWLLPIPEKSPFHGRPETERPEIEPRALSNVFMIDTTRSCSVVSQWFLIILIGYKGSVWNFNLSMSRRLEFLSHMLTF